MSRFGEIDSDATHPENHKLNGTAAPAVGDDSDDGYEVGSVWIDTVAKITYICLDASVGAAVWQESSNAGVMGARVDSVAFAEGGNDFVAGSNLSLTYESQAALVFQGTNTVGAPSTIELLCNASSGSPNYSVRIFDFTNGNVIAELLAQNNTARAIKDMGAISNLSTGPAEWQIQAKRDAAGSVNIELSSQITKY